MTNLKSSPKDVFLHLLSIITLYISAGSLIAILFQYINLFFPDPLYPDYYNSVAGSIRWSMAALIIVAPAYFLVSGTIYRDLDKSPEKRELKIRKWLVHFTLFLTALIIITDLVTLVYNFLGGELTGRFALKVLTVLLVSGTIFGYYLWDLRKQLTVKQLRAFGITVSAVILISVIAGFFTAGSPFKARLYRFDEQRVNDLRILQNEILNYWIQKDKLPAKLDDLKNNITGFSAPADPESGLPYEYSATGKLSFNLCANFSLASYQIINERIPKPIGYYSDAYQQNWNHEQGKACFSRTIDPELYKSQKIR